MQEESRGINLFSGGAEDIIRVLLVDYPKAWTTRELCKEAGVSLGWVSKVSRALIRERLALRESKKGMLRLMEPATLLRRWANYRNFAANTRFLDYYIEEDDISILFSRFRGKQDSEHAFTCLAGAYIVAPFVRPTNAHIYVRNEESAKRWAELLNLQPIEKNGNVKFAIAGNSGVFYGSYQVHGARVVSDAQLYADLLNYPSRGEEAAEQVLKKIERDWKAKE